MKKNLAFILLGLLISLAWAQNPIAKTDFVTYKLNTNQCIGLVYHTGSQIYIPENAFGTIPNNKITIKYREFHDKIDMITNKLNMRTVDGKVLESGGMFEIEAEYNGKPIKLAQGKEITVRMASLKNTKNVDVYFFDKVKNAWKKIQKTFTEIPVKTPENDSDLWGGDAGVQNVDDNNGDGGDWCEGCEPGSWDNTDWKQYQEARFEAFKSMNINEMGFYNYDKILEEGQEPFVFKANFSLPNDTTKIMSAFVVYDNLNAVIEYYGPNPAGFNLLPRQDIRIFAILKDGRVANFPAEKMKQLNIAALKDSEYTFVLEASPIVPKTGDQLAKLANITR